MKNTERHHKKPVLLRLSVWFMTILFLLTSVPPSAVLAASNDAVKAVSSIKAGAPTPGHAAGPGAKKNLKVTKRALSFSAAATDDDIRFARVFVEPLIPMTGKPVAGENQALIRALSAYSAKKDPEAVSDLTDFLTKYPKSRWHAALELDLGLLRYQTGYISNALNLWQAAWDEAKGEKGAAQMAVASRAYGELAIAKSRLGRKSEVQKLIAEAGDRPVYGSVAERIKNAKYGLWAMDHMPGDSFKCGPAAVSSIANIGKKQKTVNDIIKKAKSTAKGTSLSQVQDLANHLGLNYQAAKRSPGAPIIVPSVLHWAVGHYAAILSKAKDKYFLNDPTFDQAGNMLVSAKALDAESDGYFLVPAGALPAGWTAVSKSEADKVWGKGEAFGWDFNNMNCRVPTCKTCPKKPCGMAVDNAYKALATLNISDIPLSYTPPIGTDMQFLCNYNFLETNQPSTFYFTNLTQDWTLNWSSYLTVDASNNITVRTRGGGSEYFPYTPPPDNFTSPYAPDLYTQAVMAQDGGGYQRLLPDGSMEVFGLQDSGTSPASYFLTQVIDPQGNVTTINYGATTAAYRITGVTDAIGQTSTFAYASTVTSNPGYFQVASITDAFSRSCSFTYDSTSTYLVSITDCIGLQSQFSYLTGGSFIYMMSTPYGVTSFYTYSNGAAQTGLVTTFPDGTCSQIQSNIGELKTSYFWDREASMLYPSDSQNLPYPIYAEATTYQVEGGGTGSTGVLSSVPFILQKQQQTPIDYTYPGQPSPDNVGTSNLPILIQQGPTSTGAYQNYTYQYNALGKVTQYIDPLNRTFTYKYAANNIDLLEKRQTQGTNNDLLGKWEYNNTQHLPNVYIDGSGQETQYTYNTYGELTSVTDANSNVTTLNYLAGTYPVYLQTIVGPSSVSNDITTFTFDSVGRVHTVQDSLGYTKTFAYDNMDRLVSTTYPDSTTDITTWYLLDPVIFQDRLGRITQDTYDSMDQRIKNVDSLGRVTQYTWCSCGSLSHLTDGNGNETTWNHDILGRPLQKVYADGSQVNYSYENIFGRLNTVTDALGQVKTFSYNLDNTVSGIAYTNSVVTTSNRTFAYDPNYMRLSSATNGWGMLSYAYNAYVTDPFATPITGGGRLATITNNVMATSVISFGYDALGRTTNRSVNSSANSDTWTFDAIDRVTAESNVLGNFAFNYLNPTYGTNQVSSIVYPFGSPTAQQSNFAWYTSSSPTQFEQLQTITNVAGGTSPPTLSQYGYTYNAVSTISPWTQQVNGGTTHSIALGYDLCDQLLTASATSFWNYTYGYDSAANRTSANNGSGAVTATVNDLNQITSLSSGPSLTFDANGNMTSDGTNTYSWDAENRLIKITYPSTATSQFTFDALGGLVEIVESTGTTKQFVRTSGTMLEERDASNAVQARFFDWGQTRAAATAFYTKDHVRSIRDVTSSGGTEQYAYDPYGNATPSGSGTQSDFQYAGYYFHAPSGLNLTLNRPYSPTLGRFINRDPIEEQGGVNLYGYVDNDPSWIFMIRLVPMALGQSLAE